MKKAIVICLCLIMVLSFAGCRANGGVTVSPSASASPSAAPSVTPSVIPSESPSVEPSADVTDILPEAPETTVSPNISEGDGNIGGNPDTGVAG